MKSVVPHPRPRPGGRLLGAVAVGATLLLAACGSSGTTPSAPGSASSGAGGAGAAAGGSVKVGAYDFPEGRLLANLYADALNKAGFSASVVQLQGRELGEPGLSRGDVDVIPEYVSSLLDYFQAMSSSPDDAANLSKVRDLGKAKGVTVLTPAPATDNYAFGVSTDFATKNNIKTLSDLATYSRKTPISMGLIQECVDRSYCKKGLQTVYGMKFGPDKITVLSSQASVDLLTKGQAQLVEFNSSDGILAGAPVVLLADDKGLNHKDFVVPAVNTSKLTPKLRMVLDATTTKLTQNALNAANKATQVDRTPVDEAAKALLAAIGG